MAIRLTAAPASSNDRFDFSEDFGIQAAGGLRGFSTTLNVRANDGKGKGYPLFSLDNGQSADLLTADPIGNESDSTDRSLLGATIWINSDGTVGYSTVPIGAMIDSLAVGETLQDSFLYATRQNSGSLLWSTVTITITGTNDAPVAVWDSATVSEDALAGGSVASNDHDVDNGAILRFAATDAAPGFALSSDGSWVLDASNATYQDLAVGETKTINIGYTVTDQHGAAASSVLTVTVTGTNDRPETSAATATVNEDGSVGGMLIASDVDRGDVLTYALSDNAPEGFTLAANGAWTFAAGTTYQALAAGETSNLVIHYTVTDKAGATAASTLTITVTGTNDAPVANATVANVAEDALLNGQLSASDADAGAVLSYALIGDAPAGLTLAADGSWSFDASDAAYQHLGAGQLIDLVIGYEVSDEAGARSQSTLTIGLAGTNDSPVASATAATLSEDATASGQLGGSDVDGATVLSYAWVGAVPDGLSLAADGSWSFTPGASLQGLNAGESQNISVAYNVADPQGAVAQSVLTLTVTGVNDAPVTAPVVIVATENMTSSGRITATDADSGAVLQYQQVNATNYGIKLFADGKWTLDTNFSLFQSIAQGEVRDISVDYKATDQFGASTSSTITLRVTGVNDAPVARTFNDAQAEGTVTSGKLNIVDPDAGAKLTYQLIGTAPAGFSLASDGTTTMDASGMAYDYLGVGSSAVVSANYRVTDEFGASSTGVVNLTINGVNDRPVLSGAAVVVPTQFQGQSFRLSDQELRQGWTDADGDLISVTDYPTVDHGTVTRDGSGFTIMVDAGYVGPLTITYVLTDNKGGVVFPTLVANVTDAARIGGVVTGAAVEARYGSAGTPMAQGALTIVDVGGDESFQSVGAAQISAGGYGSFTLTAGGSWQYHVDNNNAAVAALNKGQSLTDSFTVFAADGTAQVINLTIAGATDWTSVAVFTGAGDSVDYDTNRGAAGTDNTNETVTGTDLAQVVTGGSLSQTFNMLGGNDTVYASGGDDTVYGGDGADYLMGQLGNDWIDGGAGNDYIYGGGGNDTVIGGDGFDNLYGGSGSDVIDGGLGRDFIVGGFGADTLSGGADGDTFIFTDLRDRGDTIIDFQSSLDSLMFAQIDANSSLAGDQAFAVSQDGAAAYSLWTVQNGANLEIYADVDGNPNTAEFTLIVLNCTYANWTL